MSEERKIGKCVWRGIAGLGLGAVLTVGVMYGLAVSAQVDDPAATRAAIAAFPATDDELAAMTDRLLTDEDFARVAPAAGEKRE